MRNPFRSVPKPGFMLKPKPAFKGSEREAKVVGHDTFWDWLGANAASKDVRVLEVGSRAVVSDSQWKKVAPDCDYVGFDYIGGKNVDVVGDAHQLSSYFDDESFDIVISTAVFEHLAMPWLVAEEISKVLKVGGYAAIETHFAVGEHELPWHFFHFHYEGLKYLFNTELGFEVVEAGFSNPLVAWFSNESSEYLVGNRLSGLYCHSNILVRKTKTVLTHDSPAFDWRSTLKSLQAGSSYPEETGLSKNE